MLSIDDLAANKNFTVAGQSGERTVTFLPDPPRATRKYTVISADDHIVEPADTFEGRVPAALADRAPRIVETPEGHQVWEFDDKTFTQVGMNAVAGRRPETVKLEPFTHSDDPLSFFCCFSSVFSAVPYF